MLKHKLIGIGRTILSCIVVGFIALGFGFATPQQGMAAPLPTLIADAADAIPEPNPAEGAKKAEKASEKIYDGLEETKQNIGKTEPRKDAMDYARGHASKRLEILADKAEAAARGEDSLSEVDKVNIDLMLNPQGR
ncbi:hypothetical protein [Oscillatoria sp. FACHB-1406]|uniref:hypothetical protein n=1 Tax=Oscillatoria sp. FACHB-1406 TaxID=2692846 RepID=UPI0016893489|nr:hypothetical protein [Oscillatoria sp. FACHB-1406]MBD2576517.1 hypothetical protein [Oscillatoria sp. FACHB-1406]